MLIRSLIDAVQWCFVPLYFSSPKTPQMAPMPTNPAEDPAAIAAQENKRRAATVDLLQSGRRSTMSAGNTLTDEDFLAQVGTKSKRGRGAASALGAGM